MDIPSPASASAQLLHDVIGRGARVLNDENFDHYSRILTDGSKPAALANTAVQSIMPKAGPLSEGDMAAFLALEAITDELNAKAYDWGSPSAGRYEFPILQALEYSKAEQRIACWSEVTRSDSWEYVEELRVTRDGREKTSMFLEKYPERVSIHEVDQKICSSLLHFIQQWIKKLQGHLRESVSLEKWAEAYEVSTDFEHEEEFQLRLSEVLRLSFRSLGY